MWSSFPAPADIAQRVRKAFQRRPLLAGAALVFMILAAAYVFSIDIRASRGAAITGDEPFYLLTTQSLLDDGDLDLTQQYERQSYREFFDHPDGLWRQSVPTDDGRLLSPHNPGLSVFLVPGFAAGGLLGAQLQVMLVAALAFALTYALVAGATRAPVLSLACTLAVGLSATPFIYSTEIYPEAPAAFLVVASVLVAASGDRPGVLRSLALAVMLSALVWLGVKYAPLAALVGGYALVRATTPARATLLTAGMVSAAVFAWFHLATFGELTPYSVSSVYAGDSTLQVIDSHVSFTDRAYRLWGLFIDRRFGLIRWAPVLLVALPGLLLLLRGGGLRTLALALIATQLLIATFVAITMMGWWFPGRTMMAVLPLFALPLALILKDAGRFVRMAALALGVYSLALTAALGYAGHTREVTIAVDPFDMSSALFRLPAGLFPQYTSWGAETVLLTALWLGAAGLAAVIAARKPLLRAGRAAAVSPLVAFGQSEP